jgi:biofilm protein TabA
MAFLFYFIRIFEKINGTCADHGTAFDIGGKGIANPPSIWYFVYRDHKTRQISGTFLGQFALQQNKKEDTTMFFSNITIAKKYNYLEEKFLAAYKWLEETDLGALSVGSYPILGDQVVANIQEYTTIKPEEGSFETHEKFFDIQYVVSGKEQFGFCKRDGLVVKERIEENDLIFYEEPALSGTVLLQEGDLIVVAPEDAHKPRCQAEGAEQVKKVVVKVAV